MKKFIGLSLIALLVIGFSATVYAQIDFKTYGGLFAGFIASRNVSSTAPEITSAFTSKPDSGGSFDRPVNFFSQWSNIFFEWDVGKDIQGIFNIETISYHGGTNTISRNTPPEIFQTIQGAEFDTGLWDTRVGQTRLRNAYVRFGVPYFGIPVPMTISAGIIPMATRPAFFWATTEGSGIQLDLKYDPAALTFTWGKMAEGKTAVADDSNWYSLEGRVNAGPATVGGYLVYNNMNTYPIVYNETAYGAPSSNNEANMWWLGLYADAKAGPVNLNLDFAVDTGKVKGRPNANVLAPNVKYRGWSGQAKVTYPWEKFAFGGLLSYFSGADLEKTSRQGLPGQETANDPIGAAAGIPTASTKVGSFVYPAGDVQWVIWGESLFLGGNAPATAIAIPQGLQSGSWNTNLSRGATGGTWIAKLFASAQATPWYKVTLWGLYIGDTTKNGNTLGDAVKFDGTPRDDKSIGFELSLIQDINIYKNLIFTIGSGILFAGDALDQNIAGTNINKSPKNPYMISTKLSYMF
jgi:hypothetical protein